MARRPFFDSKSESDMDPFNAGEPVMPWDDSSMGHDSWCTEEDADYDAPSPDRTESYRKRAKRQEREEARRASKQRKSSERGTQGEGAGPFGAAAEEVPVDVEGATGRGTTEMPSATTPGVEAPQPGRRRWRGCIVKGILVLIAIEILASLLSCAVDFAVDLLDSGSDLADELVSALDDEYDTYETDDEDEAACIAAVEEALDGLADSAYARSLVAHEFEGLLDNYTDRAPEELGLDTETFVDWYFENFWYAIESAYTFSDGTATVYFYHLYFDYETSWDFAMEVEDYLYEQGVSDDEALSEEQLAHVQDLYEEFLATVDLTDDSFTSLDLACEDDTWTVDEDSFEEELEYMLDLF